MTEANKLTRLATPGLISTVGTRQVEAVISDSSIARDGCTIVTAGIRYEAYLRTAAVLFNHDSSRPVARVLKIWADGDKLMARLQFPTEGTSGDADMVFRLIKENIINATSIGFIPTKRSPLPAGTGYRFDQVDLLECSFVAVPSLPTALITARSHSSRRFTTRSARVAAVAAAKANIIRLPRHVDASSSSLLTAIPPSPVPTFDRSTRLGRLATALVASGKITAVPVAWRMAMAFDCLEKAKRASSGTPESRRWIENAAKALTADQPKAS